MRRVDNPPNNLYVDGDPSTGTAGTRVMAACLNAIQEELANVVEGYGLTLSDSDDEQLLAVIRRYLDPWKLESAAVAQASAGSFTVVGDRTDFYTTGRSIRLSQTTDRQGYVQTSSYAAGVTTVSLTCGVDSGLSAVYAGQEVGNEPSGSPVGSIVAVPGSTVPSGFLELNGASLSQTTYARLYSFLKNGGASCIYGESGGNFYLPDLRGRFLRGWDHGVGRDPDRASRTNRGDGTTGDYPGTLQGYDTAFDMLDSRYQVSDNNLAVATAGAGASWNFISLNTIGGNETRPLNINLMFCIKY